MDAKIVTGRPNDVHRRRLPLGALLIGALAWSACQACGPSTAELRSAVEAARDETHLGTRTGYHRAEQTATAQAIEAAGASIVAVVDGFDPDSEAAVLAHCRGLLGDQVIDEARQCIEAARLDGHESDPIRLLQADILMASADWADAREVLFSVRDRDPDRAGLSETIRQAFTEDARFLRPVETIEPGAQITRIRALGGGSTITLKFKLEGETIAAFKPNQTRRQSSYRGEIAAFRLCPIIRCGFEVPYSFEVRVERRDFLRLYGIRSIEGPHTGYAANFADLVWTEEGGRSYLHGVWKDWVPHFTQFPIEYTDVWDSWVDVGGDPTDLDEPLDESLRRLRGRERGHYREILEEAGAATTRDLARQISSMLAFDFLINNWDRFSGAYYGVNCQWASGRFVSIDNGASFAPADASRPRRRLHQTTRFSRSLVAEVRRLDQDALLPILFPDPSPQEQRNFEAFWERRAEFLQYVDDLIEEHGEDEVLWFE